MALRYRTHLENASKDFLKMYANGCAVIRKHVGALPSRRNWRDWLAGRRNMQTYCSIGAINLARRLCKSGEWGKGRKFLLTAIRINQASIASRAVIAYFLLSLMPASLRAHVLKTVGR
jgi:hypothetical protein